MSRPPTMPVPEKARVVLSILAGEVTLAEAARRAKVSETTVGNWKRQFLEVGAAGLEVGGKPGPNAAERALLDEVEDLKAALGEAHVELRMGKKSAEYRLGPSEDLEVIRIEAGMSTARFSVLIDMPERTWRRWQARARDGRPTRGPWPAPVSEAVEPSVVNHAETHTAWGHRKVWAMTRHDGHQASASTALRILRRRGLGQPTGYTRERASSLPPGGPRSPPHRAARTRCGSWTSPSSKPPAAEPGGSPAARRTGRTRSSAGTSERPRTSTTRSPRSSWPSPRPQTLAGEPLLHAVTDKATGEVRQIVARHRQRRAVHLRPIRPLHRLPPELTHVRTKVKSPGQNGVRERAFGSLKYERLYREEITDGSWLAEHANAFRLEFNSVRPHEALSWNRPREVHLALADPATPNFPEPETLPPA